MIILILIIIVIIIIIILILIFISLTRLAKSQSAILDEFDANSAFNWGSFTALSSLISLALVFIAIILYWYDKIYSSLIYIILFFAFFTSLLSVIFSFRSYSSMVAINNLDEDVLLARNPMFYALILSIIVTIFLFGSFISSLRHKIIVIV